MLEVKIGDPKREIQHLSILLSYRNTHKDYKDTLAWDRLVSYMVKASCQRPPQSYINQAHHPLSFHDCDKIHDCINDCNITANKLLTHVIPLTPSNLIVTPPDYFQWKWGDTAIFKLLETYWVLIHSLTHFREYRGTYAS